MADLPEEPVRGLGAAAGVDEVGAFHQAAIIVFDLEPDQVRNHSRLLELVTSLEDKSFIWLSKNQISKNFQNFENFQKNFKKFQNSIYK